MFYLFQSFIRHDLKYGFRFGRTKLYITLFHRQTNDFSIFPLVKHLPIISTHFGTIYFRIMVLIDGKYCETLLFPRAEARIKKQQSGQVRLGYLS